MRSVISQAYPGPGWKKKVAAMSDEQLVAVYYRLVNGKGARKLVAKRADGQSTTNAVKFAEQVVLHAIKDKTHSRAPYDFEEDGPKQMSFADILEG